MLASSQKRRFCSASSLRHLIKGLADPQVMGKLIIESSSLILLQQEVNASWLGALIVADGEVSYNSAPANGYRYFRARVRIGIYEREPIEKAANLMGVSMMGPRKGRFEAEAQGSRAVAVLNKITPFLLGSKLREAAYILRHGGRVSESTYREFQNTFPSLRREQGKLAWKKNGAPGGSVKAC